MSGERVLHALTVDVEEYFQVANLRGAIRREDWDALPSRLGVGMDRILARLDRHEAGATFFFLGWIAERHPGVVRRCLSAGHEIASHGWDHAFLWDLGPERFEDELARTEAALAAAGAPRPIGFRASNFTLTRRTWWAFDALARRGYRYDSSVHPVRHPLYGVPDFDPGISVVRTDGGKEILEFPVATCRLLGRNWPVGGGGYLRLYPAWLTRAALSRLERESRPGAIYLHPWELDPDQPRVRAGPLATFRHRVNLARTEERLESLLARFRFGSMRAVLEARGYRL